MNDSGLMGRLWHYQHMASISGFKVTCSFSLFYRQWEGRNNPVECIIIASKAKSKTGHIIPDYIPLIELYYWFYLAAREGRRWSSYLDWQVFSSNWEKRFGSIIRNLPELATEVLEIRRWANQRALCNCSFILWSLFHSTLSLWNVSIRNIRVR